MKDKIENERIFDPAGKMQDHRQEKQIRAYLEIDDSLDRFAGHVRIIFFEAFE